MTSDEESQNAAPSCSTAPVKANSASPCAECPWRVSNRGRPSPARGTDKDSYSDNAAATLWADKIRGGGRAVCHMSDTDPYRHPQANDPAWTAAGYAPVKPTTQPRLCAGSVAAATRSSRE